ncbi:MAG: branched-chain amino acid ABC transporter permease [Hyphomicrobiaceae bacterium]|nr:branched-chain amino acid ABC transporter permease [Hyphomicrobiaceae bacterium]
MTSATRSSVIGTLVILTVPVVLALVISEALGIRVVDRIATIFCINLVLVLGLQVFMGNSGILSFAHVGFMGIGAYASAVLSMPLQMKGMALPELYPIVKAIEISPYLGMVVGGLVAAGVAAAVSYPLMRLSDAAAVITSFALLVVLHTIMVHWHQMTNGPRTLFGVQSATTLYIAAGVAILMIFIALIFRESRTGILLRAARDDEVAAGAIGTNISNMRWRGFVLSAFMAGIGGALWAHFITSFSPNAFYLKETFVILGMLVIGGAGTVSGAVLGAFVVTAAFELLRLIENSINLSGVLPTQLVGLTEIALACAMIGILIVRPSGIISAREVAFPDALRRYLPGTHFTRPKQSRSADEGGTQ